MSSSSSSAPASAVKSNSSLASCKHSLGDESVRVLRLWSVEPEDKALYARHATCKRSEVLQQPDFDFQRHVGVFQLESGEVVWATPIGQTNKDVQSRHMFIISPAVIKKHKGLAAALRARPAPQEYEGLRLPTGVLDEAGSGASSSSSSSSARKSKKSTAAAAAALPPSDELIEADPVIAEASRKMAARGVVTPNLDYAALMAADAEEAGEQGDEPLAPALRKVVLAAQQAAHSTAPPDDKEVRVSINDLVVALAADRLVQTLVSDEKTAVSPVLETLPDEPMQAIAPARVRTWLRNMTADEPLEFMTSDVLGVAVQAAVRSCVGLLREINREHLQMSMLLRDQRLNEVFAQQRASDAAAELQEAKTALQEAERRADDLQKRLETAEAAVRASAPLSSKKSDKKRHVHIDDDPADAVVVSNGVAADGDDAEDDEHALDKHKPKKQRKPATHQKKLNDYAVDGADAPVTTTPAAAKNPTPMALVDSAPAKPKRQSAASALCDDDDDDDEVPAPPKTPAPPKRRVAADSVYAPLTTARPPPMSGMAGGMKFGTK